MSESANADVRRLIDVTYERADGSDSDAHTMEADFLTGREMNRKPGAIGMGPGDNYVLLWFDKDEVAILKLAFPVFGVGEDFDAEDFRRAFSVLMELDATQVNSDPERSWTLRAKRYLRWIDPRADQ